MQQQTFVSSTQTSSKLNQLSFALMQDAVRPTEEAFRAMYERGYRTWSNLFELAMEDMKAYPTELMFQLETAFPHHPSFPTNLNTDKRFADTVLVYGTSTWTTTQPPCTLPSFDETFSIPVASGRPTKITISDLPQSAFSYSRFANEDDDHTTVLLLAWSYILTARWAEIIPGASAPKYSDFEAAWAGEDNFETGGSKKCIVDVGDVDNDAARWWAAILALEGGWDATILSNTGCILHSPWSTKLESEHHFQLLRGKGTAAHHDAAQYFAPSFATALRYLSAYCEYHNASAQSQTALAATLMLPTAKFGGRHVRLPIPNIRLKPTPEKFTINVFSWMENVSQLDRLITLSCNARGGDAILGSVFYASDIDCNICGAWLQGSFAFLDSDVVLDPHILLRVLVKRDPDVGFLWLGAFIIGAQAYLLRKAQGASWKIDLSTSAWTGTSMSFIQQPVSVLPTGIQEISRADECRLLYLSHDPSYTTPPLFPFAPFGSTAILDTNIEVREHISCGQPHGLQYKGLAWHCRGSKRTMTSFTQIPLRAKIGNATETDLIVKYNDLDYEDDDTSMRGTHHLFTWLRDVDGFPIAERAIREHEWIENLDSDDDYEEPNDR
ncbi:hypothetical protein GLAREA_02152 [Glarea lozoyensis ATCC 20868]|uniref:Uncharacterized protein n=1 Tax=Glarea lozoyensis (strain ATCC 20868 / MF5171) TaxID=1116229 RepID=S3CKH2_GLAL2|nr:uncharacterized protein GLAREA_02152 [Glarea lozoyensis ATCC 20868]EPE26240.1 hypothetical protein GLAREA_02152 [Glarea lozoyensis ATCC 20868]